jgi:hypothetical protein
VTAPGHETAADGRNCERSGRELQRAGRRQESSSARNADNAPASTRDHNEHGSKDEATSSAVAAMRKFWDIKTSQGHVPTGAELSRAAGVPPATGLGRRKRRKWAPELPESVKAVSVGR